MTGAMDDHAEAVRTRGYAVVEGVLTATEVEEARFALDEIFGREKRIGPLRGWHNDVYKVAYMLPQKHPLFQSFCQREALLSLMRALLGPGYVLSSLNGLTMTPGGRDQRLHIDQEETVPGPILCINALHTLDDFTRESGCTRLVPESHNRVWTGDADAIEAAEAETVYIEAPAGSLIAYTGGLWHAGSRNRTNRERRAIHAFFARKWMRPQWDFPRSLSPDVVVALTAEQRRLFGFLGGPLRYDPRSNRIHQGEFPTGRIARLRSILRRFFLAT